MFGRESGDRNEAAQSLRKSLLGATIDVALVVDANDVVNPAAKSDPTSPIYGMPVLNAEATKTVIVLKRSMNPGFAKIDNELFVRPNTMMLFGDAKETLAELINTMKEQG